jgi:glycosyltransferase involved in cell wall biosynthesis
LRLTFLSPSGQLGGAEVSLLDMLASLRAAEPSWPLHLVTAADGPLVGRAHAVGATTAIVPFSPAIARLGEHGSTAAAGGRVRFAARLSRAAAPIAAYTSELRTAIHAFAPDVIHSNGLKMHLLGAYAAEEVPLVWHVHDYLGARGVTSRLLRWNAGRCAAVVTNSRSVASDVRAAIGDSVPVTAIHNAVDLSRFSPCGDAADLDRLAGLPAAPAGTVRVGLVATFARWKGHDVFLDAIARVPSTLPLRAYIVGGPLYQTDDSQHSLEELREHARRSGAGDRVGFTGFVERPESALRALDVVVHASTAPEPFGLVIAEAMACQRAVITSGAGGAAELITAGEDAMTFTSGDATSLSQAIQALATDPPRRSRIAGAARISAERQFDRARLARELIPMYQALSTVNC